MKKLSKILVIVLTLAMLLGVVVISASAADNDVDYVTTSGEVITTYTLTEAIAAAKADERIAAAIDGKTVVKEIAVPNKIVNIVVK